MPHFILKLAFLHKTPYSCQKPKIVILTFPNVSIYKMMYYNVGTSVLETINSDLYFNTASFTCPYNLFIWLAVNKTDDTMYFF